jgi:hypothetical protein
MPAPTPPPLVIDAAAFGHLRSATSHGEWRQTLVALGLWDLEGLDGAAGADLQELREAVAEGQRLSAGRPVAARRVVNVKVLQGVSGYGGITALVASAVVAFRTYDLGYLWAGMGAALVGVGVAGLVGVIRWPRVAAPAPPEWPRERASQALKRLLSRTFIAAVGTRVVESTPHRAWLALRLQAVDRALRANEARIAGLTTLREHVQEANTRLGRPGEDAETTKLAASIAAQEVTRRNLLTVRTLVAGRLRELDAQLEALRAVAGRRVLSARVSRMTEAPPGPEERVVAEVEVDVAGIEGKIRALALDVGDADARLQAALEVVGAGARRAR